MNVLTVGAGEPLCLLFLSSDYPAYLAFKRTMPPGTEIVPTAAPLQAAAEELREPFLALMAELGRANASLAWWVSRLAERNPMVSPLFLNLCLQQVGLAAVKDLAATRAGRLCIVAESEALLESLASAAREGGLAVEQRGRHATGALRAALRRVVMVAGFLAGAVRRSGPRPVRRSARPVALIRTWVDDACFGPDGTFHDRYLPGVAATLEAAGYEPLTFPVLYNVQRSRQDAWSWLARHTEGFFDPASLLTAADRWFAVREARRIGRMPALPVQLRGLDVSELFREERTAAGRDRAALESLVLHRVPRRLADAGVRPAVFVGDWENLGYEKPLGLGFRDALPETVQVGYQHAPPPPLLLSYYVFGAEADYAPMPDRLVCSGRIFRDVAVRHGFPAERTVLGPALRFSYLWQAEAAEGGDAVLVALPLPLDGAAELLLKATAALEGIDAPVLVKPHPMSRANLILEAAGLASLPHGFRWFEEGMQPALRSAGVVVALGSSVLYESLAAGVPVVVVGREAALDLNPLAWFDDMRQVQVSVDDIRAEVERLRGLSAAERAALRVRGQEILRQSFEPVTDDTMSAFVPTA